jgi:hypothetical protein
MKKVICILLVALFISASCLGPRPYYKTAKGKKKQRYYNEIQFGGKSAATMKKVK